ncbi:M10 family metallopeptidase C-terminal domain-containing protein [Algirhabdus cladophorae]|uniref:M10 family metallopeptidase C-terminal domain-containing protein n=1 Tax=Algirhabdus cladophorae TaxID=3377108 RepID=UPI003B8456B8
MAGFGWTDGAATAAIDANPYLRSLGYSVFLGDGAYAFEKWDSLSLSYTLNIGDDNPDGEAVGVWTAELTTAIEMAIADIEAISGLTFTEIPDATNGSDGADIDFWYYNNPSDGASGYSYTVAGPGVFLDEDSVFTTADGFDNGLAYGGVNYRTVIHELLHNIGLGHPHDGYASLPGVNTSGDMGDNAFNQNIYTVMSYNRVQEFDANGEKTTGWPYTVSSTDQSFGVMGAFDVAMVQALYGANMTTATGDDTYYIPTANTEGTYYKAIWDAGGTDTFEYTGIGDVRIDLRAASLDPADGMVAGGIASKAEGIYGGFTIANGAVIENAISGFGDADIRGNDVANVITTKNGDDTVFGYKGADFIETNDGEDTINAGRGQDHVCSGDGKDTIFGGRGQDYLRGESGADLLRGNNGDDKLLGGGGNDRLQGGKGDDQLRGGNGADRFQFSSGDGTDIVLDFDDGVDKIVFQSGVASFDNLTLIDENNETIIIATGLVIQLKGVAVDLVDVDDFVF